MSDFATIEHAFESQLAASRQARPDSDPLTLGAAIARAGEVHSTMEATWDQLSPSTRQLLVAHGRWSDWSDEAAQLCLVEPTDVEAAILELQGAGWLTAGLQFPRLVQCWLAAHHPPKPRMVEQAARQAVAAFHRSRLHDHQMAPPEVRDALQRWSAWSDRPEIAQWALVATRSLSPKDACPEAAPWALFNASREAHLNGWPTESSRLLDDADACANTPEARFVVTYFRAIRAIMDGEADADDWITKLEQHVASDLDRLQVLQAQAELARHRDLDGSQALTEGMHLARRLGLPSRELSFHLWLCWSLVPDAEALREVLESARSLAEHAKGAQRASHEFVWVVLHVLEGDAAAAARRTEELLALPSLTARGFRGRLLCVLAASAFVTGAAHRQHLDEARRLLRGTMYADYLEWADEVIATGRLDHRLPFASAQVTVARDGRWFQVGVRRTDLSGSVLAQALLARLAEGPSTSDALIDAVWPDDASSYPSLKNRLHALVRVLRRKGLDRTLHFRDGVYVLEGVRWAQIT